MFRAHSKKGELECKKVMEDFNVDVVKAFGDKEAS
jgi:hypothetical protein